MQWEGREESENVEDRRGMSGRTMAVGGGAGIVVLLLALVLGVDPAQLTNLVNPGGDQGAVQQPGAPRQADPAEERDARFTKVILHDTEVVWTDLFQRMNMTYRKPVL